MDIFSQLDCMVAAGVMSDAQADEYREVMKELTGLQTEDLLILIAANSFNAPAGGGGDGTSTPPVFVSSSGNVTTGNSYIVDTSLGPISLTLPLGPSLGDRISFYDAQSTWATNNLTVVRSGQLIDANAGNLIANLSNAHMQLVFNGGAQGWSVYNL